MAKGEAGSKSHINVNAQDKVSELQNSKKLLCRMPLKVVLCWLLRYSLDGLQSTGPRKRHNGTPLLHSPIMAGT
jgi:hypothetical protein